MLRKANEARKAVDWSEDRYHQAIDAMSGMLGEHGERISELPISALYDDNILEPSINTTWVAQDGTSRVTLVGAIDRAVVA